MDHPPTPTPTHPWAAALARGRADAAAGRVTEIDTEQLCRDIETEADALEHRQTHSPASAA